MEDLKNLIAYIVKVDEISAAVTMVVVDMPLVSKCSCSFRSDFNAPKSDTHKLARISVARAHAWLRKCFFVVGIIYLCFSFKMFGKEKGCTCAQSHKDFILKFKAHSSASLV